MRVKKKSTSEKILTSNNKVKRGTNYIFTFGNIGAGKSTILAAVCEFITRSDDVKLRKNIANNVVGTRFLIRDWLKNLSSSKFPPRSTSGQILQNRYWGSIH